VYMYFATLEMKEKHIYQVVLIDMRLASDGYQWLPIDINKLQMKIFAMIIDILPAMNNIDCGYRWLIQNTIIDFTQNNWGHIYITSLVYIVAILHHKIIMHVLLDALRC